MDTATAHMPSKLAMTPMMNEDIVGFEDVRAELRYKLTEGCRELDVISIVGMPDLVYKRMDLLLIILHDATGKRPSFSTKADVAEKLRKTLLVKRYLILVNDVQEASAWDDLCSFFYDAKNGSESS
ncbi:hypothetical protein K7X08_021162 [Anisodus acutangulus]|uniref:NB-ARC domain-containing protein n=1 Tax=Anisodus acutangulus TaxID=402998 RepID=A0A9Q1RB71_9SOLA|nr:hypothetical protein K7X08_021162 [Anisodus acutangulus]